ncbi:hypothetical protein TNCV_3358121 [Trichonephila clavipes]|nr:hypothetical protein TNCV_3358121 [Trichonephila clavipes]
MPRELLQYLPLLRREIRKTKSNVTAVLDTPAAVLHSSFITADVQSVHIEEGFVEKMIAHVVAVRCSTKEQPFVSSLCFDAPIPSDGPIGNKANGVKSSDRVENRTRPTCPNHWPREAM